MKRFYKVIRMLLLPCLIITACETDPIIFNGPHFVRFTETEAFARESYSKPIPLEVHLSQPVTEAVTITFTVGGNAREGVDYVIVGEPRSLTVPAGQRFGKIEIELINNSNNILRSQDIVITLTGVDNGQLGIGQGKSGIGKTHTFTIFDDCILGGYYSGRAGPATLPVRNLSITSTDCERYLLSNWNIQIFNTPFEMDLIFIDNGDNTLTIPQQEEDQLPENLATISGTGFVNPLTREIEMTITLHDFQDEPSVSFTLLPD